MKVFVSLCSDVYSVALFAEGGISTSQIHERIESINKQTRSKAKISLMPKSMTAVPKTFYIEGTKRDVVFVAAGWLDTDPDQSQLENDWDLKFVKA